MYTNLNLDVPKCERLFRNFSSFIFEQNPLLLQIKPTFIKTLSHELFNRITKSAFTFIGFIINIGNKLFYFINEFCRIHLYSSDMMETFSLWLCGKLREKYLKTVKVSRIPTLLITKHTIGL